MDKQQSQSTTSGVPVNTHAQESFTFKGSKLEECDLPRLGTKAREVWDIMAGNTYPEQHRKCYGWYELNQLSAILKQPHSSLSACVRAFRYLENGGHTVDTRRETEGRGTWLYKLIPNTPEGVKIAHAAALAKKVPGRDELLELKAWMHGEMERNGWAASPFTGRILDKINEMVKERQS